MKRKEFDRFKKAIAPIIAERDYLRDELGKIRQTTTGTGSAFDPYKFWKPGMAVERGKWYQCVDAQGYIWEAIKSGIPASDHDKEYFDVVE